MAGIDIVVDFQTGIFEGDDRDLVFTCYVPGTTQEQIRAGTAVTQDVTGYSFEFAVSETDDGPDSARLFTLVNPAGIDVAAPLAYQVTVHTLASNNGTPGRYRHCFRRTDSGHASLGCRGDYWINPHP